MGYTGVCQAKPGLADTKGIDMLTTSPSTPVIVTGRGKVFTHTELSDAEMDTPPSQWEQLAISTTVEPSPLPVR